DLASLPDDGKRYEIIDGELLMSRQPHWDHQYVCGKLFSRLDDWSEQTELGQPNLAPGVIFADDDDVAPDLVWISRERRDAALEDDGHLHGTPEIAVEVLSPGSANETRDRKMKLDLYSRRGVDEYWIVNWRARQIEVYRRKNKKLRLIETLNESDTLESPLLPGFSCPLKLLFAHIALAALRIRQPMTAGVLIRLMRPGEEQEVCALVARVFNNFVAAEFPPKGIEEFYRYAQPDAMAQRSKAGDTVLVAEKEGRIVGMLEMRGFDHIAMLFVETQGQGIGRELVEQALKICRDRAPGIEHVRVHASRYAVPIYRRLGFEAEGPERTENGITYLPMLFRFQAGG
ncbi:MAG: GNAT family N-acetyltransferase, partial [Acidobacteriota bacterium]